MYSQLNMIPKERFIVIKHISLSLFCDNDQLTVLDMYIMDNHFFFFLFKDTELLYTTNDSNVVRRNVLTNTFKILVKNTTFDSFKNQVLTSLINIKTYRCFVLKKSNFRTKRHDLFFFGFRDTDRSHTECLLI